MNAAKTARDIVPGDRIIPTGKVRPVEVLAVFPSAAGDRVQFATLGQGGAVAGYGIDDDVVVVAP
jgi:hypothetical protein